jgi:hypothetical protein
LRDAREQAFLEFRLGRQNIFDAPRRVECVHAEKLKRAANKGNQFSREAREGNFRLAPGDQCFENGFQGYASFS